eukprot:4556024-Heterocapsa_arctica.AAC.1
MAPAKDDLALTTSRMTRRPRLSWVPSLCLTLSLTGLAAAEAVDPSLGPSIFDDPPPPLGQPPPGRPEPAGPPPRRATSDGRDIPARPSRPPPEAHPSAMASSSSNPQVLPSGRTPPPSLPGSDPIEWQGNAALTP